MRHDDPDADPGRAGASRRRSLMWWLAWSPVTQRSKNGQIAAPPRLIPGGSANGISTDEGQHVPEES